MTLNLVYLFSCFRYIGSGFPELYGKKSKYNAGTEFLGTPDNHQ